MTEEVDPKAERERLERQANRVRSRLVRDLDSLTDRRERIAALLGSLKREARKHRSLLIGVGIGAVVLIGAVMLGRRARARREARLHPLRQLLLPLLEQEVPAQPPADGLLKKSLRRAGRELGSIALAELGRRSLALLPVDSGSPGKQRTATSRHPVP